jgi:outer membrane murein-binding lipoprotein Lpp
MRYDLTRQQVAAIVSMLPDDDDETLRADMLEGATDLHEFVSKLLGWIEEDEGDVNALAEQIEARKSRQERAKARIASRRDMIMALMDVAGVDKLTLPEATISKRAVSPKVIFPNVDLVPDDYCKFDRKLDRDKLKAIQNGPDGLPSWATMDNGGQSITVRRK